MWDGRIRSATVCVSVRRGRVRGEGSEVHLPTVLQGATADANLAASPNVRAVSALPTRIPITAPA
jgi:hypothetical protein